MYTGWLIGCEKTHTKDNIFPQGIQLAKIEGETLTLTNTENNTLFHSNIQDLTLYTITQNNTKQFYKEGIDYIVTNNSIARTPDSNIPNFAFHKVIYSPLHKFQWNSEPDRNPELTLPYQIYADYFYIPINDPLCHLSTQITEKLHQKLISGAPLKIISVGTSIPFGAHTFCQYYFQQDIQTYPHLIAKALTSLYGSQCTLLNKSIDGGGVNQIQNLSSILKDNPDIIFVELGMNDHTYNDDPSYINYFQSSIDNAIKIFKQHNIDVILVGFFQQNEEWELENPEKTILFNSILKKTAEKYNIYFADIYQRFAPIDKTKLYKDYMGDYMHHPTSFGHQLYYLEIIPFFLQQPTKQSELLNYIY